MTTQLCVLARLLAAIPRLGAGLLGRRNRLPRLALGGGLLMFAVGQLLSLPLVTAHIDTFTTAGAGKVAYNLATMSGQFLLIAFLEWAGAPHRIRSVLWRHTALLVATAGGLIGLMASTPAPLRRHSLQSHYLTVPEVGAFYLLADAYFVYAYLQIGWRTSRYPARAANPLSPLMRLSLRLSTIAAAGLAVTALARAGWVARKNLGGAAPEWFNWANWQLSNIAFVLLAVGLSLLVAADISSAARVLARRTRLYRDMSTLAVALHTGFPEIALRWWTPAGRFRRRVIECLDGLTRLSPFLAVATSNLAALRPCELADHVTTALELRSELEARATQLPRPIEPPVGAYSDAPTEVAEQLAELSLALRRHQTLRTAV